MAHTPWSSRNGLAGRDPFEIPVAELCYMGKSNASLRWLACGEFVTVVMARSMNEAVFVEKFLKHCRTNGVDFSQAALRIFEEQHPNRTADPDTNFGKAELMDVLAAKLFNELKPHTSSQLASSQRQISKLQEELRQAKSSQPPSVATAVPPAKRMRLSSKTPSSLVPSLLRTDHQVSSQPLKQNPVSSVSSKAVSAWIHSLSIKDEDKKKLQANCNHVSSVVDKLSQAETDNLSARAVELGLPVNLASKAKHPELVRIILAASLLTL